MPFHHVQQLEQEMGGSCESQTRKDGLLKTSKQDRECVVVTITVNYSREYMGNVVMSLCEHLTVTLASLLNVRAFHHGSVMPTWNRRYGRSRK